MGNKINVGVIGLKGLPAFGGAATVGENVIRQLKDKYHFTVYAVRSHAAEDYKPDGFQQVVFKRSPGKLNVLLYYIKSALHALFKAKYDLIHLHHTDAAFIVPLLRIKYKVLCTSHAQPQVNNKWNIVVRFFFKFNEVLAMRYANEITVVSNNLKIMYAQKYRREVSYIPNGVDFDLRPVVQQHAYGDYILFAAGRIIPLKGLHLLLGALQSMPMPVRLIVIGDLGQSISYKREILALARGMDVEFIPLIKSKTLLLGYVAKARLFVFPSLSENMSMMLLEAISVRTPIVCSDIKANRDILKDDEVLYFQSGDSEDLKIKINRALNHPEEMQTQSERAYNAVVKRYNWKEIARSYENLYRKLVRP